MNAISGPKQKLRILLLSPTPPPEGDEGPFPVPARSYLMPTTQVEEMYCKGAPASYETPGLQEAVERVTPTVIARVQWAESQGYDAVVVNCTRDPGVMAAKGACGIPVIGIGEASMAVATLFGDNPARIFPAGIRVLQLKADPEQTYAGLMRVGRWNIRKRGVDVLIPDCALIGELAPRLQSDLGVPVIPNSDAGLKMAELVASLRICPEQSWVTGQRVGKSVQLLSRVAQRLQRFIPAW